MVSRVRYGSIDPSAGSLGDGIQFIPCAVRLPAFMDPRVDGIARLYGRLCSGGTQQRPHRTARALAIRPAGRPPGAFPMFFRIKWKMFFRATRRMLQRVPSTRLARTSSVRVLKINILGCRQRQARCSPSGKQFNGIRGNTIEEVRRVTRQAALDKPLVRNAKNLLGTARQ